MNDGPASPVPVTIAGRQTGTVTALSQSRQRRPIVVVLGMHRSGTSLCSHVLSALGVDMADALSIHESNAKGHWERQEIVDLHDRILGHFNRGYYTPYHDFSLPVAWWADPRVSEVRREIVAFLAARMGEVPFGFKDPRTARLMPMWHQIFGELRLDPKFIICLRNPAQVARSLHARDGLDSDIGEYRWLSYVVDCFRYTKNHDFRVLEYENWFDAPTANLAQLREFIGPFPLDRELDIGAVVSGIVDDQLRNDDPRLAQARQPLIRSLYGLARRAGDDPAAREQIHNIAAQYLGFDQMQRAFHRAFERTTEISLRVPALEKEVAELGAALALANRQTRESDARAEANAARETAALVEIDRQRMLLGELTREREAAVLAAAEAVHDEIAGLRAAVVEAERKTQGQLRIAAELKSVLLQREGALEFLQTAVAGHVERLTGQARAAVETEAAWQSRVTELAAELAGANATLRYGPGRGRGLAGLIRGRRRVGAAIRAGDRAARAGEWAAAVRHYRRALDRQPGLMAIWVQMGHVLKEAGDHSAAEWAYRRALALDGSVADTHLQLGHLLKLRDRWGEAADAYASAVQLDPGLGEAAGELDRLCPNLVAAGDQARDARNWPVAARHYRRVLARQPDLVPIWVQLGHALKEAGDYAEAEAAYRRALALDPSTADTQLQLGHLFRLQARRAPAIEAYASALHLDPDLTAAREALQAVLGYAPSEAERAIIGNAPPGSVDTGGVSVLDKPTPDMRALGRPAPLSPAERYGALFADASRKTGGGHDVIWLGVIDWHFRIQRPQHLATNLADTGARVLYVSPVFEAADKKGRFRIVDAPHPAVFDIRMRLAGDPSETVYQGLSEAAVGDLQLALDELIAVLGVKTPVVLVEHPAWHQVACGVPGATVVYDCLDLAAGFSNVAASTAVADAAMIAGADLVITASRPLAEHVARQRSSILIRNAAEVEFFAQGFCDSVAGKRPVIGYFGAIAEWFAIEWIEHCAAARPDWDFRLIGRTDGCDASRAARLANVRFLGEKPYRELPLLLRDFDVAIIPFKLVELTRCTNPVKLYEYMAAGKPVVAAALPEVIEATDLVYIAEDFRAFEKCLAQALAEDSPALRARRQAWAREHTWASRVRQFEKALDAGFPLVSVVVLTYNNWEFTKACLYSVRSRSDYPNLEIIVVDNASTDQTRAGLRDLARQDDRIQIILNDANLGFAAGNNVGLRVARGEYVILLNNDTFVTQGWVRDLIRPMQLDPHIGLTGPLTNTIGNEQKVKTAYRTMPEMEDWARRFTRSRLRRILEIGNLAFFCVAIRRCVVEEVGLLDEAYGLGYFEDDDYCRRARQANYRLVVADDVFVHHYSSVSFDALGAQAAEQMARNRVIFEERWGPWQPHRYRDEPGFG